MSNIAILASGSGSNARKIIEYFQKSQTADVKLVISNNPTAGVLVHASEYNIESLVFENRVWTENPSVIVDALTQRNISFIVLAGFLRRIPHQLIEKYHKAMVNIHPALLPKYGGKGMYGMNVHNAVRANHEKMTGITVHWVTENYDEGGTIFQASVNIEQGDDASAIQKKVQKLEHKHFAPVIDSLLKTLK